MASALHNHSEYSVLDGFSHPKEYLDRANKIGLKAFAVTEHGNQYSWVYFDKLKKDYPNIMGSLRDYRSLYQRVLKDGEKFSINGNYFTIDVQKVSKIQKFDGNNVYDDSYEVGCRSIEDRKRIYSVMRQNKNAFMKLFSLFYFDLWD